MLEKREYQKADQNGIDEMMSEINFEFEKEKKILVFQVHY